jgi:hypothetical protein
MTAGRRFGTVKVKGIDELRAQVKALPRGVSVKVADHLYRDEVIPLAQDMRARAQRYGRIGARAASTIEVHSTPQGATLDAGGTGSDLGAVLFAGSEYGGRVRKKTYARKNRSGSGAHAVTRKSTQMFLPHLGRRGYWFWPAMRTDLKGIIGRTSKAIEEVIDHG